MGAEKQEKATFSIFSAPIFLPVDDAKADKRDQTENCCRIRAQPTKVGTAERSPPIFKVKLNALTAVTLVQK
jgi:hypothetical protein